MPKSPIQAVFLDWAGTVVDHGSIAPVKALEDVFLAVRIPINRATIRKYMGFAKKDHIRQLLEEAAVRTSWQAVHHALPGEADVDRLYQQFMPQMMETLDGYAAVIPGAVELTGWLRARNIKVAGTTGYTRPMLERLELLAARHGYCTDKSLTPEDVGAGRPFPWMCFQLAIDLRIYPLSACVKIGDTVSDIQEGRNAGMWTIGLTRSGNSVGLTESEWSALDHSHQTQLLAHATQELQAAGCHFTAETVAHLDSTLEEIETRIAAGQHPN